MGTSGVEFSLYIRYKSQINNMLCHIFQLKTSGTSVVAQFSKFFARLSFTAFLRVARKSGLSLVISAIA